MHNHKKLIIPDAQNIKFTKELSQVEISQKGQKENKDHTQAYT
jgi:hypothetical protein